MNTLVCWVRGHDWRTTSTVLSGWFSVRCARCGRRPVWRVEL